MSKTILIYKNFRVRDSDSLNYVVEEQKIAEKGKNAGEVTWRNRGYCTTGKAALILLERCLVQQAQDVAATEVKAELSASTLTSGLLDLPTKKGE